MARPGDPSNDRGDGRARFLQFNDLKDRAIMVLLAVIFGGTGTATYLGINPPRPDPFTGQQAQDLAAHFRREITRVERRIESVYQSCENHRQADAHQSAEARLRSHDRQIQELWKRTNGR